MDNIDQYNLAASLPRYKWQNKKHFMNAFEMNEVLGKGINLGNALEAPEEGEWGMVIEEEFIQLIKDAKLLVRS